MPTFDHTFETTTGDELSPTEMLNATCRIVETFVDVDVDPDRADDVVVFTHRVEVHRLDDLTIAAITEREDNPDAP